MVGSQLEVEHIDLQVGEKMEIEEMTGVHLDMIGIGGMTGVHRVMTEIEEMIGGHLDMIETGEMTEGMREEMIGVMTGIEEMTGALHLDMIVTEEMTEAMRAEAGEMIAMDGMIMTTGMTVQDHLGTREPLLSLHR